MLSVLFRGDYVPKQQHRIKYMSQHEYQQWISRSIRMVSEIPFLDWGGTPNPLKDFTAMTKQRKDDTINIVLFDRKTRLCAVQIDLKTAVAVGHAVDLGPGVKAQSKLDEILRQVNFIPSKSSVKYYPRTDKDINFDSALVTIFAVTGAAVDPSRFYRFDYTAPDIPDDNFFRHFMELFINPQTKGPCKVECDTKYTLLDLDRFLDTDNPDDDIYDFVLTTCRENVDPITGADQVVVPLYNEQYCSGFIVFADTGVSFASLMYYMGDDNAGNKDFEAETYNKLMQMCNKMLKYPHFKVDPNTTSPAFTRDLVPESHAKGFKMNCPMCVALQRLHTSFGLKITSLNHSDPYPPFSPDPEVALYRQEFSRRLMNEIVSPMFDKILPDPPMK